MKILLFISIVFFSLNGHARNVRDYAYPNDPRGWSWFPSFYLPGSAFTRYGSMVSGDSTTIEKRSLSGIGADLYLGFVSLGINWGGGVEITSYSQLKDPSEVNNSNASGTQKSAFITAGLNFGKASLFGKYYPISTYDFSVENREGNSATLDGASSSYSIEGIYHTSHHVFISLSYAKFEFTEYNIEESVTGLNPDSAVSLTSYGLSLGYIF